MSQGFNEGADKKVAQSASPELDRFLEMRNKLKELLINSNDEASTLRITERLSAIDKAIQEEQRKMPSSTVEAIEGEAQMDARSAVADVEGLLQGSPTREELLSASNLIRTLHKAAETNPKVADVATFMKLGNLVKELDKSLSTYVSRPEDMTLEGYNKITNPGEQGGFEVTATSDRANKRDTGNLAPF